MHCFGAVLHDWYSRSCGAKGTFSLMWESCNSTELFEICGEMLGHTICCGCSNVRPLYVVCLSGHKYRTSVRFGSFDISRHTGLIGIEMGHNQYREYHETVPNSLPQFWDGFLGAFERNIDRFRLLLTGFGLWPQRHRYLTIMWGGGAERHFTVCIMRNGDLTVWETVC